MTATQAEIQPLTFSRWAAGVVLRWHLIALAIAVVLGVALLAVVLLPPTYRAKTTFVANTSGMPNLPAALGSAAGLAAQLGIAPGTDPSSSPAFYADLLRSRELQTRLLQSRFADPREGSARDSTRLLDILEPDAGNERQRMEKALKRLEKQFRSDFAQRTGIVQLEVDAEWASLSAAMANRAVDLVSAFNREQRASTVRSKRQYLEERLAEARAELQMSEQGLRSFYERNRLWRGSPALVSQEQQLRRRGEIAADLYLALQRQYDTARLEELNSVALITVVDSAVVPHRRQWPRYGSLLGTAILVGGLAGLFIAGALSVAGDWAVRNPEGAQALRMAARRARSDLNPANWFRGRSRPASRQG